MKEIYTYIFLTLISCSCIKISSNTQEIDDNSSPFEFSNNDLKILVGGLGEIKLGMRIAEAEKKIDGFEKKIGEANDYGYGGGSPIYLYSINTEIQFGLIPKMNSDTILAIIAIGKELKTSHGLHPNSSVKDVVKTYPNILVRQNLMNGWEYFPDTVNNWDFVILSNSDSRIGTYSEINEASKPTNFDYKINWITIE